MNRNHSLTSLALAAVLCVTSLIVLLTRPAQAYVEIPYTLGRLVNESTHIMTLKLEKVDKANRRLIFSKIADIKGKHPQNEVKHVINNGFEEREWKTIMNWAEPGKTAVFLHNGGAGECMIDGYWYQIYPGDWWSMSHAEPYLGRSFHGRPEKLAAAITAMLAGQEVIVPAMVDGDKNAMKTGTARVQRLKASLKIVDYNPARDFVGWGGNDEFRKITSMPGFLQLGQLPNVGPGAAGIASADFDADGKLDLCLFGEARVVLLQNAGNTMNETSLPYSGPARSAEWGDFNGDGKPDLLLATPTGPKLFTNSGNATFKDDSKSIPAEQYYNCTAAAFIDADGDNRPDILLANGFLGLRLYRNLGPQNAAAKPVAPATAVMLFEDVSDSFNLGLDGVGGNVKGDRLVVHDVNGDGRQDFLYAAGTGLLALSTGSGYAEAKDTGLNFQSGGVTPIFADFNGDKRADLLVPQQDGCKLFAYTGSGKFTDITATTGDLARIPGHPTSAAIALFKTPGVAASAASPGLIIGCLKGPNRYLKNVNGKFTDASDELGLYSRVFNTRSVWVGDLNKKGTLDVVFNNEGQDSAVLLGDPEKVAMKE